MKILLRVLLTQSFLAMGISIVVAFAKINGDNIGLFSSFSYLFAGLIGMTAYQSIYKVMERIAELENRLNEIKKQE